MAAIFGSAVRRAPRFITFLKNSATRFSMGTVACSNDSLPMSECRDSAIAKRLTAIASSRIKHGHKFLPELHQLPLQVIRIGVQFTRDRL